MTLTTSQPRRAASIEALESRIAPAGIVTFTADHKTATWIDVDGDTVTLKATKAIFLFDESQFTFLTPVAGDVGHQLALLDLHLLAATSLSFAANKGVGLTFTAKRNAATHLGDGYVNVGRIDATGLDLGAVSVSGDLASITAGSSVSPTMMNPNPPVVTAITSVTAGSAGALGTDTQGATLKGQTTYLDWLFVGSVGAITIKGDCFVAIDANDTSAANAGVHANPVINIGAVTILGDLVGGNVSQTGYTITGVGSGYVYSEGKIGAVKIGGDLIGGTSYFAGSIAAEGNIASVTIGGDLFGSGADSTASVFGDNLGKVSIGGSIFGGSGPNSGLVSAGKIASITVGGEVDGGAGDDSGKIHADTFGAITVKQSLNGGAGKRSGQLNGTTATSVSIGGSINGGTVEETGEVHIDNLATVTVAGSINGGSGTHSGSISAISITKGVTISGDLVGGAGENSAEVTANTLKSITLRGSLFGGTKDGAGEIFADTLGSVTIGRSIFGGSGRFSGIAANGDLTSITVAGGIFGGSADQSGTIFAAGKLGKVVIGGSVHGGSTPRNQQGNLPVDNNNIPLTIYAAGSIHSNTSIGSVSIAGNVAAGEGWLCGAIFTDQDSHGNIKSVTIGGTLGGFTSFDAGNNKTAFVANGIYADGQLGAVTVGAIAGSDPLSAAQIVAQGKAKPATAFEATAIGSVTVLRGAYAAEILAGFSAGEIFTNPDVIIGTVKVGNSFVGSSISAGVDRSANGFGVPTSAVGTAGTGFSDGAIRARIASVTIGGYILGNPFHDAGFNTGIVAQDIGAVKIGGTALELTATTPTNLDAFKIGVQKDFFVREVA